VSLSEGTGYGILVALLLAAVGISIIAPPAQWTFVLVITLEGAAALIARRGTSGRGVAWLFLVVLVGVSIGVAVIPGDSARTLASSLDILVLLAIPTIIVLRFRRDLYVTVQSIFAAVSVYLVLGLLYAVLDSALSRYMARPFFAQASDPTISQYTYFSFITLCTVGYGDLTPGLGFSRAMAVSEALLGQLYLVTVIALVIANLGHQRRPVGQ
jgi:hypothetical protein